MFFGKNVLLHATGRFCLLIGVYSGVIQTEKGVNHGEISTEDHDIWSELLRKIILCQKSSISPRRSRALLCQNQRPAAPGMFKLMYDFGLRASEVGKLILKGLDWNAECQLKVIIFLRTSGGGVERITTRIRECKEQPRLWQPLV